MKIRNYYAVSYFNGVASCAKTGNRYCANYHAFPSKAERDEWCKEGGDYRTSPDFREPILSSDPELRAELRQPAYPDPYKGEVEYH